MLAQWLLHTLAGNLTLAGLGTLVLYCAWWLIFRRNARPGEMDIGGQVSNRPEAVEEWQPTTLTIFVRAIRGKGDEKTKYETIEILSKGVSLYAFSRGRLAFSWFENGEVVIKSSSNPEASEVLDSSEREKQRRYRDVVGFIMLHAQERPDTEDDVLPDDWASDFVLTLPLAIGNNVKVECDSFSTEEYDSDEEEDTWYDEEVDHEDLINEEGDFLIHINGEGLMRITDPLFGGAKVYDTDDYNMTIGYANVGDWSMD